MRARAKAVIDQLLDDARDAPWPAEAAFHAAALELAEAGIALGHDYPLPVVDHAAAREQTLARYGILKKES